jgi:hypothetical protein
MNILRASLIVFILGFMIPSAWAQSEEEILQELEKVRDPFLSYLIKKVEPPPPPPPVPVVVKPPEVPKPKIEQPTPVVVKPVIIPVPPAPKIDTGFLKDLKLSGVIWDTDMPQAIISDKVVKTGDVINGSKITLIDKKGVEITHNGLKYLLTVSENDNFASQGKP